MHTRRPKSDGLALIRPLVSYAHCTRPVSECTANNRPSVEPKYASPSTTAADDSTFPAVWTFQMTWPLSRRSARTAPSFELTISRGPSIAGVEGFSPPWWTRHTMCPFSASTANVSPKNVFT